jgi:hypothetical protein
MKDYCGLQRQISMIKFIMRNEVFNCMTTVTCCKRCRLHLTLRSISNKLCPKIAPCINHYHHISRGWISLTDSAMWRLYLGRYWMVTMLVLTLIPHPEVAGDHPPLSNCISRRLYEESLYQPVLSVHTQANNCCVYLVFYIYLCMHLLQFPTSQ